MHHASINRLWLAPEHGAYTRTSTRSESLTLQAWLADSACPMDPTKAHSITHRDFRHAWKNGLYYTYAFVTKAHRGMFEVKIRSTYPRMRYSNNRLASFKLATSSLGLDDFARGATREGKELDACGGGHG